MAHHDDLPLVQDPQPSHRRGGGQCRYVWQRWELRTGLEAEGITAFDKENLLLYVSIHQNFKLWAVPFYNAPVKLVTVLQLTTDPIPQPSDPYDPSLIEQPDEEETSENGDNMGTGNKRNGRVPENSSSSAKEAGEEDIYYILSQNDLYQTSEFIKFVVPWGLGVFFVGACQIWATVLCVVGTKTFDLLVWLPRKLCSPKYVNEELDVD